MVVLLVMETEGRGRRENFVNRKRLNIVARSVAVVGIAAAGAAAVEKTGLFDPLESSVNSANHLVLNNLRKSYEQLIDTLPEVEKAEAAAVASTCTFPAITSVGECNNPIGDGYHIAILLPGKTCHANVHQGNPGSDGVFDVQVVENIVNCTTFDGSPLPVNATFCCADAAPKPTPKSVGGIAELPDVNALPQNIDSEKSTDYTLPIAAGITAAVAAAAATGGVLYSRRNRSAK